MLASPLCAYRVGGELTFSQQCNQSKPAVYKHVFDELQNELDTILSTTGASKTAMATTSNTGSTQPTTRKSTGTRKSASGTRSTARKSTARTRSTTRRTAARTTSTQPKTRVEQA